MKDGKAISQLNLTAETACTVRGKRLATNRPNHGMAHQKV
jgi:hypothetical protein